jgi:virginiamycin B lyase
MVLAASLLVGACAGPQSPGRGGASTVAPSPTVSGAGTPAPRLLEFPVPHGAAPHDVAPARDGGVWFTAQAAGYLGYLDPRSGAVDQIPLGAGSRPHGVITAADGAAWITDGGLNAIVRVDAGTREVRRFPLPAGRSGVDLNTATFDSDGVLWFTGQGGVYGRLDARTADLRVYDAPSGRGPYGIAATPGGDVYFVSLAGSYLGRIDTATGRATVIRPPTAGQGARRVWSDSRGRLWISEWNAGQLARYDPASGQWREWRAPGDHPQLYAVYVDDRDVVWATDFGSNRLLRFDPAAERFEPISLPGPAANVRQLLGRPGQVLGAASALDRLLIVQSGA